uniref:Uncharacterized protein K02A2.6-like n=1 Tax=Nicotiana sylvestris TaxID=4096 RepID=A0A1U7YNH4_NICSY|nr:PREDICTED: uncharacterized protein K02A2.6-like [Nicotiana sylvestris]
MPIQDPPEITCDNGKQFISSKVTKFLEGHKIKRILSTLYHPCANGQAESTNKTIIQKLKKRLENAKGKWKDVLPEVLWAYRTTSKSSTGETPFSLVYGFEALIPVEMIEQTLPVAKSKGYLSSRKFTLEDYQRGLKKASFISKIEIQLSPSSDSEVPAT